MKEFKVNATTVYHGHLNVSYRGVKMIKCPFDYVMYQMIIFELKPDLVIEIGSNRGGNALYIADLLNIVGSGEVHTIDIQDSFDELVKSHNRIKTFTQGYQAYNLELTKGFHNIMVIEDASHTYTDSLACLKLFSPLVSKNSYYIVEDGIVDKLGMKKQFGGGPKKAIDEFLKTNPGFEIDYRWCNMFGGNATFNINGYLKKVK